MKSEQDNLLSGIADEAADDIAGQIRAHAELGWKAIELRLINRQNIGVNLPEEDFETAATLIQRAGLTVTGVSSAIGNWSRPIDGDFKIDVDELTRLIPRMRRLGATFLRTMSWKKGDAADRFWRDEGIRRYRELAAIAREGGVVLLHENCEGWAGQSADHTREFMAEVASTSVGVLYDIGNTISHGYKPWEFYAGVKSLIRYIHVKDCRCSQPPGGRSSAYAYPGEGDALVREILSDLLQSGYKGVISIEPHVAAVVHLGAGSNQSGDERFKAYVEYGRRLERILAEIRAASPVPS